MSRFRDGMKSLAWLIWVAASGLVLASVAIALAQRMSGDC